MGLGIIEAARFTPPTFAEGLENWSSGDGVAGDPGYDLSLDTSLVLGDSDFGACLELRKTIEVQKLRSFTQTPILKQTYLRVRCRVKMISGHFPGVRIAGWAGAASGAHIAQVTQIGPSVVPTAYGQLLEVSAIIGPGLRDGVDMVWALVPIMAISDLTSRVRMAGLSALKVCRSKMSAPYSCCKVQISWISAITAP